MQCSKGMNISLHKEIMTSYYDPASKLLVTIMQVAMDKKKEEGKKRLTITGGHLETKYCDIAVAFY